MSTVRERRLQSDYARLNSLASAHSTKLTIESMRGNPPETYLIVCRGRSIAEVKSGEPVR